MHTIDMDNVQKIFSICKYYDEIINYEIEDNDILTFNLIDFYKDYVFSHIEEEKVKLIDECIYKYISDYNYQKGLKKIINNRDIDLNDYKKTSKLIRKIIKYDDNYENNRVRNITVSKWL